MKPWEKEKFDQCCRKNFTGSLTFNFNQGGVTSIVKQEEHRPPKEVIKGTPEEVYGKGVEIA